MALVKRLRWCLALAVLFVAPVLFMEGDAVEACAKEAQSVACGHVERWRKRDQQHLILREET